MPVVPTYQGPQVREQALQGGFQQNVDVTRDARTVAQGLMQVGEAVDRIDLRDAQAKASNVESQITEEWMKWDASKEGRAKYRGENADGYAPAAEAWWEDARKTYGKDLDPRAGALASRSLQAKKTAAMGNVVSFTAAEKQRHATESFNADLNTTIQFGITSGDVASTAKQIRDKTAVFGAANGWTTEQVQAEAGKNLSALHLAQITKLADQDAAKAQAYYDANKAEIGFAQQPKVEEILRKEVDNQFATQFAAQQAGKPLSEQLAAAGEIKDPNKREKALQEVKNNHAMVEAARREAEQRMSDQAWQLVGQGKKVPEALLAGMDGKERVQLQEHQRARAERLAAGTTVKTNPAELARVYDMMRDDPEGFKKLRMQTLTNTLAPTDIEQVSRIQRDMLKPDREKDVATTSQLLGVYTGGWTPEKRAKFEAVAYDELNRLEKEKGRPANYDEKKKTFDRLMMDGEVLSGSWYTNDPNKKFYEATPEERAKFAPTINDTDRNLVKSALQAEGIKNPTNAQITERFKLAKGIK